MHAVTVTKSTEIIKEIRKLRHQVNNDTDINNNFFDT